MDIVLGHWPSSQPAVHVVVDTPGDSQVQDTQTDDEQQTGKATPNSDIAVPSSAGTDLTDTSGEVATTFQV